ncbi:sensor histidine kinase [Nocardiopsis ansamitocini]|uniref:Signal transduction histidine kinase subgroup 3 dimerisation and phosphoacceptor domain-containing protein n=1 Tax=Nocardiopsis ansamitocini TaxID=1670832 RepID=A0A9W6UIB6_9ACTN|nr:sensor histidine kinase [Nocardiopsis ansamitocini]GLU47509.1 hypothetical protein Nans01_18600 [Nocardiopsis ansamitocini]
MTHEDTGPGTVEAGVADDERSTARLKFARRTVYFTFTTLPLGLLFVIGFQAVLHACGEAGPGILAMFGVPSPWAAVLGFALSVPLAWLTLRFAVLRLDAPRPRSTGLLYLGLVLNLGVLAVFDVYAWVLVGFALWWSAAALVATRRQSVLFAVVLLAAPAVRLLLLPQLNIGLTVLVLGYTVFFGAVLLVCDLAMVWLWEIANEATVAREARARLAVTEERLRFARDLHDLVGHSLSGIAVKSELAARLAARDPERAAAEMVAVQQVARDALREVRAAVSGYRDVDLTAEVESVRQVLSAAGTRVGVAGDTAECPVELRALTAWLVREGATNVLRHSGADRCDITLTRQERSFVVEVYNDGVRSGSAQPFGNGLNGLTERVTAVGGGLSATTTDDGGFLMRAVLPIRSAPAASRVRQEGDQVPA